MDDFVEGWRADFNRVAGVKSYATDAIDKFANVARACDAWLAVCKAHRSIRLDQHEREARRIVVADAFDRARAGRRARRENGRFHFRAGKTSRENVPPERHTAEETVRDSTRGGRGGSRLDDDAARVDEETLRASIDAARVALRRVSEKNGANANEKTRALEKTRS